MMKKNQYNPDSVTPPGGDLREKLEEMGMGPKEFAVRVGKPEQTITAVLKGDSSITPDMAVQFENVTRIPARYWLNRQRHYDEYLARERRNLLLAEAVDWAKHFPTSTLEKLGWIPKGETKPEKADALLGYFQVAGPAAWQNVYLNSALRVQFRLSLAHTKEPYALAAWLRRGEVQAEAMTVAAYEAKAFRTALAEIKQVMADHPADFLLQLQARCAAAGVKVVHTPCLPKVPISGATRWLGDTPLIQLSGRYRRNDSFWFTFFHEAGHILLHGKKDVFLESVDYDEKDMVKEREADDFAIQWTFTEAQEREVLAAPALTKEVICGFARRFGTHPALIIGRFQHKKLIPFSLGREFVVPVVLDAGTADCA